MEYLADLNRISHLQDIDTIESGIKLLKEMVEQQKKQQHIETMLETLFSPPCNLPPLTPFEIGRIDLETFLNEKTNFSPPSCLPPPTPMENYLATIFNSQPPSPTSSPSPSPTSSPSPSPTSSPRTPMENSQPPLPTSSPSASPLSSPSPSYYIMCENSNRLDRHLCNCDDCRASFFND